MGDYEQDRSEWPAYKKMLLKIRRDAVEATKTVIMSTSL